MKHCLQCRTNYASLDKICPVCGYAPTPIDGFDAYAPALAHGGGGFKPDSFPLLASLEEKNFWFRGRNELIVWALEKYGEHVTSFLEIGCGTGFVLSGVGKNFPRIRLAGSEVFTAGLGFAAKRLPSATLMQMDARSIPFHEEFDAIGAFDVLEHIKEDDLVLAEVRRALKPEGLVLLTVPQHTWLWSVADEYACHERRYGSKELHNQLEAAGFRIIRSTSFMTALLPAMMFSRLSNKCSQETFDPEAELRISSSLNAIFSWVLKLELSGIRLGLSYPVGGSRLIVARKTA